MAPKRAYTAERLRDVGAKAAKAAKKKFPDCEFACVYTGDAGAVVSRSQVCFEWRSRRSYPSLGTRRRVYDFAAL